METCAICGELQDFKHFERYSICTTCADLMEDVMGEYFLRTIWKNEPRAHAAYLNYLNNTTKYISDYKKLAQKSDRHIKDISARVSEVLENNSNDHPSKKRYLEHMQKVVKWLETTPHFYHYYFKDYYVCPNCGASIFDKYTRADAGGWMVISCSECDSVIKKYFSPKMV